MKSFKILKLKPKVNRRIYLKVPVRCKSANDAWDLMIKNNNKTKT